MFLKVGFHFPCHLRSDFEFYLLVSGMAPWIARVDEIKSALSVNVEAERKIAQLNDEIQALARNVKIKDQNIQESSVKIELMERRLEVIKKQAEMILDLENKLASAKKDAKKFREDMESLQIELEMEQKNAKSMTMTAGQENQGESFPILKHVYAYAILIEPLATGAHPVEPENMAIEGSLETSYLLEQVGFRGVVVLFTFFIEFFNYRLMLSEELYVSSEWKIRTSRVKIYFEKLNHFHLLCNLSRVYQRRHSIPQATRTLKSLTRMNRLRHLPCSLLVPKRRGFIAM